MILLVFIDEKNVLVNQLLMKGRGRLSVSVSDMHDNQFMDAAEVTNASKPRAFSKDIRLQKLQERNTRLQQQIIRIQRTLSQADDKVHYGVRLPQIKGDVIRKQLQNAYKMIKQYEYGIGKKRKLQSEESFVEQLRKYEKVLKQKTQLSEKLRKQGLEIKKQSIDMVKLLKNDSLKKQHTEKQIQINADIKWVHQKIKRMDAKKNILNVNLQKQQVQIQRIEKQLTTKYQYEKGAIQNIRNRVFNATTYQMTNLTKEDDPQSDEQLEPLDQRVEFMLYDRTPESYGLMMNEVKLFRKLQKDYEGKIELLVRQKQDAEDRNFKSRNRLVQVQYQIDKMEASIAQLKKQVDPKHLKPTKMDMLLQQHKRNNPSGKINKPKLTMAHSYKSKEVGEATKAGRRFIDRTAIGKRPAKIVGITFYQQKDGGNELMGIQAVYMVGSIKKKGNLNCLADISTLDIKEFNLQAGDFVKTVDCMTDAKGVIVGISMVSDANVILKGGAMTANRYTIEMGQSQIPICLFGCLLPDGIEMFGCEMVAQQ